MGYRLRDELEISIFLDGKEFPLSEGNSLNFLHCAESTKYQVPTMHFAALDVMGAMSAIKLNDGTKAQVFVKSSGLQETMHFRANTWSRTPSGGAELFDIDCFLDAPKFRLGTTSDGFTSTSSEAMRMVAERCGLKYSGLSTNDAQTWLPRNQRYAAFVNHIANHGYATPSSHLVTGVDLLGRLLYKDIRAPARVIPVCYHYESPSALQCLEFSPIISSGISNSISGYRDKRVVQSVMAEPSSIDSLEFVPKASRLMVNQDVRDQIERANITYSPIDFGNVHDNFERARYQNARFDALRSLGAEFIFDVPTQIRILDTIGLTSKGTTSEYDGDYVVSHKTLYVQGSTYIEKIIGYREGMK